KGVLLEAGRVRIVGPFTHDTAVQVIQLHRARARAARIAAREILIELALFVDRCNAALGPGTRLEAHVIATTGRAATIAIVASFPDAHLLVVLVFAADAPIVRSHEVGNLGAVSLAVFVHDGLGTLALFAVIRFQ